MSPLFPYTLIAIFSFASFFIGTLMGRMRRLGPGKREACTAMWYETDGQIRLCTNLEVRGCEAKMCAWHCGLRCGCLAGQTALAPVREPISHPSPTGEWMDAVKQTSARLLQQKLAQQKEPERKTGWERLLEDDLE